MASTRIAKIQAEKLSELLAESFIKEECAVVRERQASAHRAVADLLFTPEVIARITSLQASMPDVLRSVTCDERVYLLDQNGQKRDNRGLLLDYRLAYGAEENRTFALDWRTAPKIQVTQRQYEAFVAADEAAEDLGRRKHALRRELFANILAARTVEKLIEKWPEAGSAIASFFNHVAVKTVEVPLEQLVRRHVPALALAAPVEDQQNG
jgi:hypothetical protein